MQFDIESVSIQDGVSVESNDISEVEEGYHPTQTREGDSDISKLKVCFSNVDTLSNKLAELEAFLSTEAPSIVGLCEIFPKNSYDKVNLSNIKFNDYDTFTAENEGDRGVMLLIHKTLKASRIDLLNDLQFNENVLCEISLQGNDRLLVGVVYRSPGSDITNNQKLLDLINRSSNMRHSHYLLMGDFNYKDINWETCESQCAQTMPATLFLNCILENFLHQHINVPTRYRDGQSPSCLDLVFTNEETMIIQDSISIGSPLGKSDHAVISFEFLCYCLDNKQEQVKYQYYKGNYVGMAEDLSTTDWHELLDNKNVNDMWLVFKDYLEDKSSKYIPKRKSRSNFVNSPLWLNGNARTAITRKNRAWKKYKYSRSPANYAAYAESRNICTATVRESKRSYEKKIAEEAKTDNKSFWKYVNSKRKTRDGIGNLSSGNQLVTDDQGKAEVLNTFFSSVFVRTEDLGEDMAEDDMANVLDKIRFTPEDVLKALKSLKHDKSPGPDGIHPKVLCETKDILYYPLYLIFSQSFKEGCVPDDWRKAIVTPIFKKGKRTEPSNYRPVSLTSVICKLCESIIRGKVMSYLIQNSLLSDAQYGFRPGRSCVIQLLEILDEWTKLIDGGDPIDVVYLDFSKAFDSVAHERLIIKLHKLGIRGEVLKWIESFLTGRSQRVRIGTALSSWTGVASGVPQGSVLGPVLFLCFINDMPDVVEGLVKIFADDTKIYSGMKDDQDFDKLQADIDNLCDWSNKWKLSFNVTKCKVMHIGYRNENHRYTMKDSTGNHSYIESVASEKDLGVVFDEKLNFEEHITCIVKKAQRTLGIIHRSFEYMDKDMFLVLYKSIIRPVLEYGSCVWSPHLKKDILRLEDIQRRATKLVPDISTLSYEQRLMSLGLPTLEYRRERYDMLQIYKAIYNIDDLKWDKMFKFATEDLRGHHLKFIRMKSRNNTRHHTFSQRSVNIWNNLSSKTVSANSINSFKSLLNKEDWNKKKFQPSY